MHPMLGDPDADYINANYIDVSHGLAPVISADLALPALGSLSREGRNLSADKWGFKWLGSEWPHLLESVPGCSEESRTEGVADIRKASRRLLGSG